MVLCASAMLVLCHCIPQSYLYASYHSVAVGAVNTMFLIGSTFDVTHWSNLI